MSLEMRYFILKPGGNSRHHKASRMAMRAYSRCIKEADPELAQQLADWANKEAEKYSSLPEEEF